MNANRSRRMAAAGPALGIVLALAGCVSAPAPSRGPPPAALAPPPPLPPPAPLAADWRDAPATPGDWTWTREGSISTARFAGGLVTIRCGGTGRDVLITRAGNATGALPMTVTTTSLARSLSAVPQADGANVGVLLSPRDPLLDAMAFSRGRIAVEVAGMAPLYIPAWPEMARVIEDCR